ncbi:hypothetical protein [Nonomuraea sp. B1E8]
MFTTALVVSLICLAIPVSTYIRMVITGRRIRSAIRARVSAYHHIDAR